MSLRHFASRFSKVVWQGWTHVVGKRIPLKGKLSSHLRSYRLKRLNVRFFGPRFWRQIAQSGRVQSRSVGVIGSWLRYGSTLPYYAAIVGTTVAPVKPSPFDAIKHFFKHKDKNRPESSYYPTSLDGYDIGDPLGKGCNASVYEARIRSGDEGKMGVPQVRSVYQSATNEPYNLAIKMMFNYTFGSRLSDIIEACKQELVPSAAPSVKKLIKWDKTLSKSHPNVINIHAAFADRIRLFSDSIVEYPQALPAHLFHEGLGWDQTLFIVMSRYKMTLRQYILTHEYGVHTGQVLYGQLVEAIRFLVAEKVAHRDMKSNNILIEFNRTSEIPLLVVSDFGCCLANDSLKLSYFDEDTDLGGNLALRPPEISCARPGMLSFLDFSRSDLWASGAIAYEIFTRCNPFYKRTVSSKTYLEEDLPDLPKTIPVQVRRLIKQILARKPEKRPSPECAATVMALSCFDTKMFKSVLQNDKSRGFSQLKSHFTEEEIAKCLNPMKSDKSFTPNQPSGPGSFLDRLSDVMSLYSAETMLGRICGVLSRSEIVLRTSFLSRLDSRGLLEAVEYFV